jgi:hypothetical protein
MFGLRERRKQMAEKGGRKQMVSGGLGAEKSKPRGMR